ncbi:MULTISPECIES: hypothetical protein [unclassified Cupriavidus]|uniref:hypothetical protein n=1 Tax=unclassified Cupriavidus TaxID=2640874 RepID=UPI00313D6836
MTTEITDIARIAPEPLLAECAKALRGVIAVADRKTDEFDYAGAVLAKLGLSTGLHERDSAASPNVDELVASPAVRADEVDAEIIHSGLGSCEGDISTAADTAPHGDSLTREIDLQHSLRRPANQDAPQPAPVTAIPVRSADKDCNSGHLDDSQPAPATGDEREAFEASHRNLFGKRCVVHGYEDAPYIRREDTGGYADIDVNDEWLIWQASAAHRREGWQPIETAPEGQLVVVLWFDSTDPANTQRHDFDFKEDGVWHIHNENYEHYLCVGGSMGPGPSEQAPYTHWMPLPAAPAHGEPGALEQGDAL